MKNNLVTNYNYLFQTNTNSFNLNVKDYFLILVLLKFFEEESNSIDGGEY
jgi:hypothetical protein